MKPDNSEISSEFWKPSQNCVPAKLSFNNDGKIKAFLDKETRTTFPPTEPEIFTSY